MNIDQPINELRTQNVVLLRAIVTIKAPSKIFYGTKTKPYKIIQCLTKLLTVLNYIAKLYFLKYLYFFFPPDCGPWFKVCNLPL